MGENGGLKPQACIVPHANFTQLKNYNMNSLTGADKEKKYRKQEQKGYREN